MSDYFPNETPEKSFLFKMILTLVGLMVFSFMASRIYSVLTFEAMIDPNIKPDPLWLTISIVILSIITIIGLFFTYKYKKIGVYTVATALFLMVSINPEFDVMNTLAPLFTLFVFIGYGFMEIVPKWRFFK